MSVPPKMTEAEMAALPAVERTTMLAMASFGAAAPDDVVQLFRDSEGALWEITETEDGWAKVLRVPAPPKPAPLQQPEQWRLPDGTDVHEVTLLRNILKPGQQVFLDAVALGSISFNYWLYHDLWAAFRGNLMGSAYGTWRRKIVRDGWVIRRLEDGGERMYDRDGYPLNGSFQDPATDLF